MWQEQSGHGVGSCSRDLGEAQLRLHEQEGLGMGTGLGRFQRATKGDSPSGDIFPHWAPVWLGTQGDPREAADWPGRNKGSHAAPPAT